MQFPEIVEYAEPDAVVRTAATTPNDPRFAVEQWSLNNTGQDGGTVDATVETKLINLTTELDRTATDDPAEGVA